VVAADLVYMPYGGKYAPGGFSSRPRDLPVDGGLVSLARKVRRDKNWQNRIRAPHGGTLPSWDQYPVAYPPDSVVAPVASIEAVLADPDSELEQLIAARYGDTCVVEMEGYGAMYAANRERNRFC
jgi:hypothetical protein